MRHTKNTITNITFTVQQFVNDLPTDQQPTITYDRNTMLSYLRSEFHHNGRIKHLLVQAAKLRRAGKQVLIDYESGEQYAAQAIVYAVAKMADKLPAPKRTMTVKRTKAQPSYNVTEFETQTVQMHWGKESIQRYNHNITHEGAARFQQNDLYNIGDFEFHQAGSEHYATAHFEASDRNERWGVITCDGEFVETVNCWYDDPYENREYENALLEDYWEEQDRQALKDSMKAWAKDMVTDTAGNMQKMQPIGEHEGYSQLTF